MPWEMENIISTWNSLAAEGLGWRSYTDGKANSRPRSLRRLGVILDKADTTVEEFTAELTTALVYIQQEGTETVNQRLGKQYNLRITFWRFASPPDAIKHLSELALGRTAAVKDQDKARRDQKAELLRDFETELKEWVGFMAYRSRDNAALEQALEAARGVMAAAESELEQSTSLIS